ncbi:hypothetical protein VKT23_010258 [Stygiomarasmius scandens]|uniref:Uncharacterized protein n=1 Tax=Marasmiellus scandens TaxID=2682957 RepID=A0ABR1JIA9_9AGAR
MQAKVNVQIAVNRKSQFLPLDSNLRLPHSYQVTYYEPAIFTRTTPWSAPGSSWLRTFLLEFLTPSYQAAVLQNEEYEFMEMVTWEWLHRFPSDIFPGTPLMLLGKWGGDLGALDWAITKVLNTEYNKPGIPFVKAKEHLLSMFQVNVTMGTVRVIKKSWEEEMVTALSVYDREYPVDSSFELNVSTYLSRDKEYVCFAHRSQEQQSFDLLWSYQEFDYDT